jgi:hypothetical protein
MSKRTTRSIRSDERQGISNRESAAEERREREEHPPIEGGRPEPVDAGGDVGEKPRERHRDGHTAHKAGSKSVAQKEEGSRYPDRSTPPSRKVAGAFGREPGGPSARDADASSHPKRHQR